MRFTQQIDKWKHSKTGRVCTSVNCLQSLQAKLIKIKQVINVLFYKLFYKSYNMKKSHENNHH
jgi:hypothetical protein